MRRLATLVLILLALPAFAQHYEGKIDIPGRPLPIEIDVDGAAAKMSIPVQNIHNLTMAKVRTDGGVFVAETPTIPGNPHFEGSFSADRKAIRGTFTQGTASFPFDLAQTDPAAKTSDAMSGFDGFAAGALTSWNAPGASMAIVTGGKVVYAKGFGKRDVKNDLPVTTDTLFATGSCTKAFTTFVLGQLVDEGKVDWDKPVARYLPGFRLYDTVASQELTPRDLVTHRSGLPRHDLVWYNNQTLTRKDLVERLQYLPPSAELRERWQYNNLMYLTAGYLIEQLTGKRWEDAVLERVFTPVGMTHSNFADLDSQKVSDFAKPYRDDHDKLLEIPFREVGNMGPAGSINSTASDMAKWMLVQLGDAHQDLIQQDAAHAADDPRPASAGAGVRTGRVRNGLDGRHLPRPPARPARRQHRRLLRARDALPERRHGDRRPRQRRRLRAAGHPHAARRRPPLQARTEGLEHDPPRPPFGVERARQRSGSEEKRRPQAGHETGPCARRVRRRLRESRLRRDPDRPERRRTERGVQRPHRAARALALRDVQRAEGRRSDPGEHEADLPD